MPSDNFLSRLRKGRLVQVLLIYLGASWLVLQVGDTLEEALGLPDWVLPTAFLLLLVGLLIVLATAWVQSHPLVHDRAASEEVPHAWELDAADLRGSLTRGRVPHLTWPRALLGGLAAFFLLTTVAATVMLVARDGNVGSPSEASGSVLPGLAVMPFTVSGEGSEVWREGMVDLLSTGLDGAAGLRTIDTRTVLARWRERFGEGEVDAMTALEAARATGARYALLGSAVSLGERVRLSAELFDLHDGEQIGEIARVEGARDSMFALIDAFAVAVLREALRAEDLTGVPEMPSLESVTTSSMPALLAYLEGEARYRRAEFQQAIEAYERAVAEDSTFALPYYRLSVAYGWTQNIGSENTNRTARLAMLHADHLAPRDAALVRLAYAIGTLGIGDSVPRLRALAERYPDDPEIWYELGEAIVHFGERASLTKDESLPAFQRVIELDSTFAPAYIHPIELTIGAGEYEAARALLDALARYPENERQERLLRLLMLADGSAPANLLDTLPLRALGELASASWQGAHWDPDMTARIAAALLERPEVQGGLRDLSSSMLATTELLAGRPGRAAEPARSVGGGTGLVIWHRLLQAGHTEAEAVLVERLGRLPRAPGLNAAVVGGALLLDRGDRARHAELVGALRARADSLRALPDSAYPDRGGAIASAEAGAAALLAYARWKDGDPSGALPALQGTMRQLSGTALAFVRRWVADILNETGRHADAARQYEVLIYDPTGVSNAALAWEHAGERERAQQLWALLVHRLEHAEPGLPLLAEAREGLRRTSTDR